MFVLNGHKVSIMQEEYVLQTCCKSLNTSAQKAFKHLFKKIQVNVQQRLSWKFALVFKVTYKKNFQLSKIWWASLRWEAGTGISLVSGSMVFSRHVRVLWILTPNQPVLEEQFLSLVLKVQCFQKKKKKNLISRGCNRRRNCSQWETDGREHQ